MPLAPTEFYQTHLAGLHQQLLTHPLTHTYLSGTSIRVDGKSVMPEDRFDLPFGNVSTIEFAHLFSIFNGSRVHQQAAKTPEQSTPPGLYFTVINNNVIQSPYKNRIGIYTDQTGATDLHIDALHIDHYFLNVQTPPLLGTISFAMCAITAHLAGMSQVSLVAAGGRGFDHRYYGYKVWPKFGFDAPVERGEISDAPNNLAHCTTVQQVISTDQAWWEENGSQRMMTFNLTAHSASWEKMLTYLGNKLSLRSPS